MKNFLIFLSCLIAVFIFGCFAGYQTCLNTADYNMTYLSEVQASFEAENYSGAELLYCEDCFPQYLPYSVCPANLQAEFDAAVEYLGGATDLNCVIAARHLNHHNGDISTCVECNLVNQ